MSLSRGGRKDTREPRCLLLDQSDAELPSHCGTLEGGQLEQVLINSRAKVVPRTAERAIPTIVFNAMLFIVRPCGQAKVA